MIENIKNEQPTFFEYYINKDIANLSKNLSDVDQRIKFEKWLLKQFSLDKAVNTDFAWHSKVISLLCAKTGESSTSVPYKKLEDRLIASLISKAQPLPKKNQGFLDQLKSQIVKLVHNSAERTLNFSQVYSGLKYSALKNIDLPSTYTVLFRRMLTHQHLDTLVAKIMDDDNLSMFKVLMNVNNALSQDEWRLVLNKAVTKGCVRIVKFLAEAFPKQFETALTKTDEHEFTPVGIATFSNNLAIVKIMTEQAFEAFKKALTMPTKKGLTSFHFVVLKDNVWMMKVMATCEPNGLIIPDISGWTPLAFAASKNNMEMVQAMAKAAPATFTRALTMQTEKGTTPFHMAAYSGNMGMVKLMADCAPHGLSISDNAGNTVLSVIKARRPLDYRTISQLFKNTPALLELREFHKTQIVRKALSHAWHISGTSNFIKIKTKESLRTIDLTGHNPTEWFYLMRKNLNKFSQSYPDTLSKELMDLLKHLLDLGANNPTPYSLKNKIEMIKKGLPVVLDTGFAGHAVTLLIWGDQFVICNRGSASRHSIEFFHFDPNNLEEKDLKDISGLHHSTQNDYTQLLFEVLSKKLKFVQNELDLQFQATAPLPAQTVGNCTLLSPITAIYGFLLLGFVRGIDQQGRLMDKIPEDQAAGFEQIKKAIASYQTWLSNEQITILEKNILPLKNGKLVYKPDHRIIVEALRKAHRLPLDNHCQERVANLTQIYLNFLDEKKIKIAGAKIDVKCDLEYWKAQKKAPLL